MKRKFYLMVESIEEEYAKYFFERFGDALKTEKRIRAKLKNYESVCGNYVINLDSRKIKANRIKINKTQKFYKKMDKCFTGIYLPDTLEEFLNLCQTKTTLIEAGEGRDAVHGKISINNNMGVKTYYLKGEILNAMKAALIKETALKEILKY